MRRRDFLGVLGAAVAAPPSAYTQEPGRIYRIGLLNPTGPGTPQERLVRPKLTHSGP